MAGNEIVGNGQGSEGGGLLIDEAQPGSNIVRDYLVGTDIAGDSNLGNNGAGITFRADARPDPATADLCTGNTVTANSGPGIVVLGAGYVDSRANVIHGNGGLGLDLSGDGVTPTIRGVTSPAPTACRTSQS